MGYKTNTLIEIAEYGAAAAVITLGVMILIKLIAWKWDDIKKSKKAGM